MRLKKYQLYRIRFLDHAINIHKEMIIEAVGFFVKSHKHSYVFSHWLVIHDDLSIVKDNLEPFVIVKKAVLEIVPLRTLPAVQ